MADDALVERLNIFGAPVDGTLRNGAAHSLQGRAMMDAADRIEALSAEVAELTKALRWARTCVPFPSDCHNAICAALHESPSA